MAEALPASGAEADLYRLERDGRPHFLKLYRAGLGPDAGVLARVRELSARFPGEIVRIEEAGFDEAFGRHYEIQEWCALTLADLPRPMPPVAARAVLAELARALEVLHGHGILHLDLKPSNVLLRSAEPLDLVFTDFGVSSALDPETSRRLTGVKGTPLYWAPESFTGVVGREADLFALGMILLELLAGEHPFRGLDMRVIAFTLATRAVELPPGVPEEFAPLLAGLLARDPRRRATLDDVRRFLAGGRLDFPADEAGAPGAAAAPLPVTLRLAGREYRDFTELLLAASSSFTAWDEARAALGRGVWRRALERTGGAAQAAAIEAALAASGGDPDLALVRLLAAARPDLPFSAGGLAVTAENLRRAAARAARGEASAGEARLVDLLLAGKLAARHAAWCAATGADPAAEAFGLFLAAAPRLAPASRPAERRALLARALECLASPDAWLFPAGALADPATRAAAVDLLVDAAPSLLAREEFERFEASRHLPPALVAGLRSADLARHREALEDLRRLEADLLLVERARYADRRGRFLLPGPAARLDGDLPVDVYRDGARLLRRLEADGLLLTAADLRDFRARNPDAMLRDEALLADPVRYAEWARRVKNGVVTAELPRLAALDERAARLPEGEPRARLRRYLAALRSGEVRWEPAADRPAVAALAALVGRLSRRSRLLALLSPRRAGRALAGCALDLSIGATAGGIVPLAWHLFAFGLGRIGSLDWVLRVTVPLAALLALYLRAKLAPAPSRAESALAGARAGLSAGPPLFAAALLLHVALLRALLARGGAAGPPEPFTLLLSLLSLPALVAALLGAASGALFGLAIGAAVGATPRSAEALAARDLALEAESVYRAHRERVDAVTRAYDAATAGRAKGGS